MVAGTLFPAIELCQFARSEDARRDQQHALATLIG
jgi:hypothetical protein